MKTGENLKSLYKGKNKLLNYSFFFTLISVESVSSWSTRELRLKKGRRGRMQFKVYNYKENDVSHVCTQESKQINKYF